MSKVDTDNVVDLDSEIYNSLSEHYWLNIHTDQHPPHGNMWEWLEQEYSATRVYCWSNGLPRMACKFENAAVLTWFKLKWM